MNIGAMAQVDFGSNFFVKSGLALKDYMASATEAEIEKESQVDIFANLIKPEKNEYPYSALAHDGIIEYNGVVFVGDSKTNSINLGDMSDKNQILRIQLSGGGFLNVNYDNIGDLKDAIGMFSGQDQGIILKAISTYHFENGFVKAAEEEEEDTIEKLSGDVSGYVAFQSEAEVAMELMMQNGSSLYDKLVASADDGKISVGPSKVEVPQWDPE